MAGFKILIITRNLLCTPPCTGFRRLWPARIQITQEKFMNFDKNLAATALCFGLASVCGAQNATPAADQTPAAAPAPPPAAGPLPSPSITGPIQELPPAVFDAGPFGKVEANGFLSGMGLVQNNHVPGDKSSQVGLS